MYGVRIENHIGLIAKRARLFRLTLPLHMQRWVDLDDMIQDGILFARSHVIPKYDYTRARFSTILQISIDNFYKMYINKSNRAKNAMKLSKRDVELVQAKAHAPGKLVDEYAGEKNLLALYNAASPSLKDCLDNWFFSEDGCRKVVPTSVRFKKAKKEFLRLAAKHEVDATILRAFIEKRLREDYNPIGEEE